MAAALLQAFAVPGAVPGHLVALESVGSTNDEACRLGEAGSAHFTVVWALEQTQGRGRLGRKWQSPRGNLYCSVLLRPAYCPAARVAEIGFLTVLAMCEAIEKIAPGAELACKWPNDLLLNGRKLAGFLPESSGRGGMIDFVVVGSGVNIARLPKTDEMAGGRLAPACLAEISAAGIEDVLQSYCGRLVSWYDRWEREGFAPVRAAWLAHAYGLNGPVAVTMGAEKLEGRFVGMDADGALLLEASQGTRRRILAGDVAFGV